jgi:hypothetical protein
LPIKRNGCGVTYTQLQGTQLSSNPWLDYFLALMIIHKLFIERFSMMWCYCVHSELVAYKLYPPSTESARWVKCDYGDNDYRLIGYVCPITGLKQADYEIHN